MFFPETSKHLKLPFFKILMPFLFIWLFLTVHEYYLVMQKTSFMLFLNKFDIFERKVPKVSLKYEVL